VADELAQVLDQSVVARLSSPRSYERGVIYLEEGRVGTLRASAGRVAATVQGTDEYAVDLAADGSRLGFACSCPVGREGGFCKHCVAVALAWLREHGPPIPTLDDAKHHLEGLPRDELVDLLIEHAHEDEQLARRLLLMTVRPAQGAAADVQSLLALIDQAFACHGFVPYREMWGWVKGIHETVDVLEGLLEGGRAADVVELAEHALAAVERALDHVDDSDGEMGDVIGRLERLHRDACNEANPDPVALAERLFRWELGGHWDIFDQAAVRYADVLGDAGLARYCELAEEAWADVPALGPGDQSREFNGSRFRITRIMEGLAGLTGSLADQVAVRERNLSSGYRFLEIAELCQEHGDDDAALEWAERGMAAFASDPDPRLRAFVIDEYRRRGRTADALKQSIAAFAERPTLETYRELANDAIAASEWTERREWGLAILRGPEPGTPVFSRRPWLHARGRSELVRVFLSEDDLDSAWQAATEGGCTRDLWLELADRRRDQHPEDALEVYQHHVEGVIEGKDKRAYAEAARLIDKTVRALFLECGRAADFDRYVEDVRMRHKAKRNLMKAMADLKPVSAA
jgi:uncharacterized Zn finger protein